MKFKLFSSLRPSRSRSRSPLPLQPKPPPPRPPLVGPPGGMRLPPEVLLLILELVSSIDTRMCTLQAEASCYSSLCLVSRWFGQVTFPLLYRYVFVPTQARVELFLATVEAEGWADRKAAGETTGLVKLIWIGHVGRQDGGGTFKADPPVLLRVLGAVDQAALETLVIADMGLIPATLGNLSGLSRLELHRVVIRDDGLDRRPCLPQVTEITMTKTYFASTYVGTRLAAAALLAPHVVPRLSSLTLLTCSPRHQPTISLHPDLAACLGQIEHLTLFSYPEWIFPRVPEMFAALPALKALATADSDHNVQRALPYFPASLETLDLTLGAHAVLLEGKEGETEFKWSAGWAGVKGLKKVVLPLRADWVDHPNARKPAKWLAQVEAAARKQGVQVEFK